jgi:hypothetical protein
LRTLRVIESAARGAQFLLAIGIAYAVALWFALVAWTFRDIESRSRSVFTQVFSTLLVVLFFIPGLVLYLILRPKETLDQAFQRALEEEYMLQDLDDLPLCRGCQRAVDPEYVVCPHCQTRLRAPCPACARLIDLRWSVCAYCAVPVDRAAIDGAASPIEPAPLPEVAGGARRNRAIAAAAQRLGMETHELDALSEALSGSSIPPAVAAGNTTGTLSRRLASLGDITRLRSRVSDAITPAVERGEAPLAPAPGSQPREEPATGSPNGSDAFWAEPLPPTLGSRGGSRGSSS